jgi:hypothetical protein
VLHDAEDLVHPLELKLFDRLIERAALVQLPVLPLIDPNSRWISGHYCDEFAEAHIKELVVREAVGAAIPLAGVGCAIERARSPGSPRARRPPFAGASMTEDYEMGLRLGALGLKTMFVRIPATPGSRAVVASRGHFPADLAPRSARRRAGSAASRFAGWDRLGWRGGLGERWMRMRDRRGPLAALLLVAAMPRLLWLQIGWPPRSARRSRRGVDPALATLLTINGWLLGWRLLMRACFTTAAYGSARGCARSREWWSAMSSPSSPRPRAVAPFGGGPSRWDKTRHIFPRRFPGMSNSIRFLGLAVFAWAGSAPSAWAWIPGPKRWPSMPRRPSRRAASRIQPPRCRRSSRMAPAISVYGPPGMGYRPPGLSALPAPPAYAACAAQQPPARRRTGNLAATAATQSAARRPVDASQAPARLRSAPGR